MSCLLRLIALSLAISAAASNDARAQQIGDADKGHQLAEEVCASCHAIGVDQSASPEPFAPTFETIANVRGMSPTALSVFLRTPHATMPNLVLTDDELGDVIAYILSLKE